MKILATTHSIRKGITDLMLPGARRVVITAFVGDGAEAYLPRPKGVQIICWPKAGGTNPLELRRLKKRGARIYFVNSLHMKIYWAQGRGLIISSANLTTNALGSGGLKEIGVLLPAHVIEIGAFIKSLKPRRFNRADIDKLEEAHRKLTARRRSGARRPDAADFKEWYSLPARADWKFDWWEESTSFTAAATERVKRDFGRRSPEDALTSDKKFKIADWVLTIRITKRGARAASWLFVDFSHRVSKGDPIYVPEYPYESVQISPTWAYPSPPFTLTDTFRRGLREAIKKYGVKRLKRRRSSSPDLALLKLIAAEM